MEWLHGRVSCLAEANARRSGLNDLVRHGELDVLP